MAVQDSGTVWNTPIELDTCDGSGAEQWRIRTDGTILNPESGLCLTDPYAATLNGTQLVISTCSATAVDQTWTLS
jgi:hypothetical protein